MATNSNENIMDMTIEVLSSMSIKQIQSFARKNEIGFNRKYNREQLIEQIWKVVIIRKRRTAIEIICDIDSDRMLEVYNPDTGFDNEKLFQLARLLGTQKAGIKPKN